MQRYCDGCDCYCDGCEPNLLHEWSVISTESCPPFNVICSVMVSARDRWDALSVAKRRIAWKDGPRILVKYIGESNLSGDQLDLKFE